MSLKAIKAIDPLRTADRPGEPVETVWRPIVKRRAVVMLSVVGCWMALVAGRLVQLQVFQHDELVAEAAERQQRVLKLNAKRGDIVDRHGTMLAYSVDAEAIIASDDQIDDPKATAEALCRAFGDCAKQELTDLVEKLSRGGYPIVRQSRFVSDKQAQRVAALKLPGISFVSETRRYYPKKDLAAHLLGFVGKDNQGLAGVEDAFDALIRGREGRLLAQKDARRKGIMWTRIEQAPTAGATLELTIDQQLQHIAERELRDGIAEHHARAGTAIVMDPRTGDILALANFPTFNPNAFNTAPEEARRNRAIQEIYEPGSTFKIVTASAALEEGVFRPTDLIDCGPGRITIGSRVVDEASGHNYGVLTFEDVIVKSSNVGAIRAGLRVGADRMGRYMRRFGFGETLAPDFRGESRGIFWSPADLDDSALASISMGYQIGVTPLQMVTAVSAVANGGVLFEPHVVRAVIKDGRREPVEPRPLRRAIAADTAAALTAIMEEVVRSGTAKAAALPDHQVAGKTGTATKVVDGRYSYSDHNASFIGFVPSRQPVLSVLVVIDTPRGTYYGGTVAAPIFKRIADASLRHLGVAPTIGLAPAVVVAEDLSTLPPVQATRTTAVLPAGTEAGRTLMPDVRGLGAREALRVLVGAGLSVQMDGSGVVRTQRPEPGEPIGPGASGVLQLRRALPARPEAGVERR
jgi:cell division protein FtsI/penicillin-binding protein 2